MNLTALIMKQCNSISLTLTLTSVHRLSLKWESSKRPGQFGQRHRDWLHGVAKERAGEAATETHQWPRSERCLLHSFAYCTVCIGFISIILTTFLCNISGALCGFIKSWPNGVCTSPLSIPWTCKENVRLMQRFDNCGLTNCVTGKSNIIARSE